jgi:hypothetical protein
MLRGFDVLTPDGINRPNSLCHVMSFAGKSQSPNALSLPAFI